MKPCRRCSVPTRALAARRTPPAGRVEGSRRTAALVGCGGAAQAEERRPAEHRAPADPGGAAAARALLPGSGSGRPVLVPGLSGAAHAAHAGGSRHRRGADAQASRIGPAEPTEVEGLFDEAQTRRLRSWLRARSPADNGRRVDGKVLVAASDPSGDTRLHESAPPGAGRRDGARRFADGQAAARDGLVPLGRIELDDGFGSAAAARAGGREPCDRSGPWLATAPWARSSC